jgi:hypothetical protein
LNPGFKVVSRASSRRRMFFFAGLPRAGLLRFRRPHCDPCAKRQYGDGLVSTRYAVAMTTQPRFFP